MRVGPALREIGRRPWHLGMGAFAAGLALAEAEPAVVIGVATGVLAATARLAAPAAAKPAPRAAAKPAPPAAAKPAPRAAAKPAAPAAARPAVLAAVLVLCGAAVGDLRLAAIDAPGERARDGGRVALSAHLLTPPRPGPFGASAEVEATSGRLRGARLLVRAARWAPLPRGVRVGEELRVSGRLQTTASSGGEGASGGGEGASGGGEGASGGGEGASGGGDRASFDFAAYLRGRGVAAELLLEEARRTGRRRAGLAGALDAMRERAERAVVAGMPGADGALLRGMVLGQDEAIETGLRDDFRDSGLAHLLAVSGQNVILLAALALPALALAGMRLRARLAALVALIALYVPLAGAGPSLQRAGVMGLAGIAAIAASRPASRSYALLLAAAATLAWNPRAWTDPGWQLSFAAVVGILALGVPLAASLRRHGEELLLLPRPCVRVLADGVAVTVAATLATAPLLAHHFGSVPVAGLPANLLALPAVAPAMWLGMLKIALGQAGGVGAAGAEALGGVAALPVAYIASLAERCADLPVGRLVVPLRSPVEVLAAYAALAAVALLLRRAGGPLGRNLPERAARWRRLPRGRRAAIATTVALAVFAVAAPALDGRDPPGRLTVRFLDVGQGDATLIQHPDGTAVLFDGGPPEAGVARLLRKAGVERLAAVVATHASRDHHGGLAEVLRGFPVGTLLDGGDGSPDPAFREVLHEAARQGVRRMKATAPLSVGLAGGALRIRVLSPAPRPPGPPPDDPNPRAVVALVTAGAFDLLLSADAESDALLPLDLPDVDAMKIAHHGSADPGLRELLDRVDPELAAIEVGPNTYGHPAPSTLAALERADVTTYRTDRHGTISLTIDRGGMRADTER